MRVTKTSSNAGARPPLGNTVQGRGGWSFLSKQLLAADEWQREKRFGCYSSTGPYSALRK
jgi:hypothetical protein